MNPLWYIAPLGSLLALVMAVVFFRAMKRADAGNARMQEIASYVRQGAMAYLLRQYKIVSLVFAALFVIFAVLAALGIQNPFVPVAFLTGGFFSGLCGYIGMKTATLASSRTAQGCQTSLNRGLQLLVFHLVLFKGEIVQKENKTVIPALDSADDFRNQMILITVQLDQAKTL